MFLTVLTFALVTAGLLLIPSHNDNAHAQQCFVTVCKSASGPDGVIFPFTASQGGESESFELSNDGFCLGFPFVGNNFQIVEEPVPDWVLDRVECDSGSSAITYLPDGLSLDCVEGLDITCEFLNIYRPTENVPTLSEWSMIAAAAGLALVGVFFALRRKRMMHEA